MANISMFFGIIIKMFYSEHEPAHFHAEYQGQRGAFNLEGELTIGNFKSKTALKLIKQWAKLHNVELKENWKRMKKGNPFNNIEPLE